MTYKGLRISREVRERAAEYYLESSDAEHGDEELAEAQADHWANLFEEAEAVLDDEGREAWEHGGEVSS